MGLLETGSAESITSALIKIKQVGITVGNKGRKFKSPGIDNEKWKTGERGAIKKFYRGDLVLNPKRW